MDQVLLGTHDHTLDEKSRLTLPAKLRDAFADGVVVSSGMDGCLYAIHVRTGTGCRSDTRARPAQPGVAADAAALLLERSRGRSRQAGADGAAPALMENAKLGREVTVAGVYDHLEIWDRAAWRAHLSEVEGSAENVAERVANRD